MRQNLRRHSEKINGILVCTLMWPPFAAMVSVVLSATLEGN